MADPYEDKTVLVVGIGNSAVDIAVDLARRARRVLLSTRRSAWIMPKYIMGVPTDRWLGVMIRRLKLPVAMAPRLRPPPHPRHAAPVCPRPIANRWAGCPNFPSLADVFFGLTSVAFVFGIDHYSLEG